MSFNRAILLIGNVLNIIFSNNTISKLVFKEHRNAILQVIQNVRDRIGFQKSLDIFGISVHQFRYWSRKIDCVVSPLSLCRRIYYNQLTEKEVDTIKKYLLNPNYINWSLIAIYFQMLRDGTAYLAKTTFYKYSKLLNLSALHKHRRKNRSKIGIRATSVKQIFHMDVTIIRALDGSKIYISFIIDNFSRCILGWKASLKCSSDFVVDNLKEVIINHNLFNDNKTIALIVDGGAENKGKVDDLLATADVNFRKLVAMLDIIFSNSMIESVNKKIKYDYLFTRDIKNFNDLLDFLKFAVYDYNNRPHSKLHGCTPTEVLNGAIPNKLLFSDNIKKSVSLRMVDNLNSLCEKCLV